MNARKILSLIMLAGETMLESGAETHRIEETMQKMAQSFNCIIVEAFVTTTGIFATLSLSDSDTCTMVKRVHNRSIHLEKVALVNNLSREMAAGKISFDMAEKKLMKISALHSYPWLLSTICIGLSCFCFCFMFGGLWSDCFTSLLSAACVFQFIYIGNKKNISRVLINIMGGAAAALTSLILVNIGLGENIDKAVIGAIMPLVPGMALTNAIRDILEGDYLSGSARIMDALIVAVCIAVGVGSAYRIWTLTLGGLIL